MIKKLIVLFASLLVIVSCGHNGGTPADKKADMSNYQKSLYDDTLDNVKTLEDRMFNLSSASFEDVQAFISDVSSLDYRNDTTGMSSKGKEDCAKLERRISILKKDAEHVSGERLRSMRVPVEVDDDCLLEAASPYPVYLERGDVLYYKVKLQKPGALKLFNMDAKQTLKSYTKTSMVNDSLVVKNAGIYLVEILPLGTQYASIDINYRMGDKAHSVRKILSEETACGSNAFRAVGTKGIKIQPAFDGARKFTLRSQFKSIFSGASKVLVAVSIPSGATELLYNIRISTSEQDTQRDGKFNNGMNATYNKVRFLGLPLYESSRGSGLFNTLLDDNRPIREEDAYCNMYVFRSQSYAKQFQDGLKMASELPYDVEYSTLGTQSCNGRIPTKGAKTIYLAFENERVRYSNYIWLEVSTAFPVTEYHTTKYSLE